MKKQILFMCTVFCTTILAMEKSLKVPLQLTHESPEITCIHTQKYLKHLEKQVIISIVKNNSDPTQKRLNTDLDNVADVLNAINNLIELKKESARQPHYNTVELPTSYGYSYASNKPRTNYYRSAYALMPIAAAYALKNSFNRILIIDEALDLDPDDIRKDCPNIKDPLKCIQKQKQRYYVHGNGSLLYPDKNDNPELFNLFNDKVITYDRIYPQTLLNFFNNDGKDTDLVLYHMNTCSRWNNDYGYQWNPNIFSLFQKLIPTIFIIPDTRYSYRSIPNGISSIAATITNLLLLKKNDSSSSQTNDAEDIDLTQYPFLSGLLEELPEPDNDSSSDSSSSQNSDDKDDFDDSESSLCKNNDSKLPISSFVSNLFLPVESLEPLSHNSDSSSSQDSDNDCLSIISSESEEDTPTGMAAILLEAVKNSSNESSSCDDSYDLDPFVFKITTDTKEARAYDGANLMLLAKKITITDDGVMEIILDPFYATYCSPYQRYRDSESTTSNDNETNDFGEISSGDDTTYNQLTPQSPEITCVHTQEYLEWLSNNYDAEKLASDLKLVSTVLNTTNNCIKAKNKNLESNYHICIIPEDYHGAGNNEHNYADSYAIIPIAAAHALRSNVFKRILIIEEHINKKDSADVIGECNDFCDEYRVQGNGSLFWPSVHNNPDLFNFFKNKIYVLYDNLHDTSIISHDKIWDESLIYHNAKNIDLVFYNINEDFKQQKQRESHITCLLENNIPIIFICSSQPEAHNITNFITKYEEEQQLLEFF